MATGTVREQRAAPPWVSPEETCDGGFRKGPPDRAIGLPDVAGLQGGRAEKKPMNVGFGSRLRASR